MLRTARIRWVASFAAVCAIAAEEKGWADGPVPVIVLATATTPAAEISPRLARVSASLAGNAQVGPALSQLLRERYGHRPPTTNTLADAGARVDAARSAYNNAAAANDSAAMNAALDALERVASELEAQADILATFPDAREQLSRALLFIANTTIQTSPTRADDALRRLATADPQRVLSARSASSAVRQAFTAQVAQVATASLIVESTPAGCEVFRDGRAAGNTPAQFSNLAPGTHHRVSVRCGGRTSLVHGVTVASGTTSTFRIDVQLDSALDLLDAPTIRYATLDAGRERWGADLVRLGSAIGAQRVFGLIAAEDRVIAVDVVSGAIIGESPVTDGAQLRRLALGAPGTAMSGRTIDPAGRTGDPHRGQNGQPSDQTPIGVQTPRVGLGETRQPPQEQWREVTREVRGGVPAGAFVLGSVGLAAIGGGITLGVFSQSSLNRAQQLGSNTSDVVGQWQGHMDDAALFNTLSIVSYATGGVLIVTGALVGVFGRSTTVVRERVRVSALPLHGGAGIVVGGAL